MEFEYNDYFRDLYEKEVAYLLCGGLAVNLYGIPRMTADIDLILEWKLENIDRFLETNKKFGYNPLLPISLKDLLDADQRDKLITEKNLIAYSFFNSLKNKMNIDIIVDVPVSFRALWERKTIRKIEEFEVHLISMDDLIQLKSMANRPQDISDVKLLRNIQNNGI